MACAAFSNISASRVPDFASRLAVQVPEYSPSLPATDARHAPAHPSGDLAADHPPSARVLPCASRSAHVPVAVPLGSRTPVHAPISVRPLAVAALHEPVCLIGAMLDVSGRA